MSAQATVDELARASATGAVIVDVREPEEYAAGHVAGSRLIPLATLPDRLRELPSQGPVFVICHSGRRSLMAARFLSRAAGIDARSVAGGTAAWTRSGRPLDAGGAR